MQVCLRCAVTVAKVHAQNTVYIDTCGSFSAHTALHFLPDIDDTQQVGTFLFLKKAGVVC